MQEPGGGEGQRTLEVPDPEIGLGALDDHHKIDTYGPGREAPRAPNVQRFMMGICAGGAPWALQTKVLDLVCGATGRGGLDLNDDDSGDEGTESHRLGMRKGLTQRATEKAVIEGNFG